jgi:outer membrane receptor protein involved in Fe transport
MHFDDRKFRWAGLALAGSLGMACVAGAASAPAGNDELEEVVVTGSRIASPNATSTSPVQVVTARDIQITGKSDISDIISQLPQNFNNDLGQDLGNRTPGLTTAGGVATADLRGLGPQRTLVLVNGRRLGQGSPYTFIQSPAPDLDQIPASLVERVEVVTGGASATYGSDAIAGVVNFIMKKDFEGLQVDGQFGENWHQNHNDFAQGLERKFGLTPLTGTSIDGRNRALTITAGANFSDGKGNVTAYFSYLKSDPVRSSDRDFGGCQMNETFDANTGDVIGAHCAGSSNSNFFNPLTGPNANAQVYSVSGSQFVPRGSVVTNPPASYNSQPFIYMARGDQRYTAGFMAHAELDPHMQPYAEFGFMNDRTHQEVAPAALFRGSNPNDPLSGNYNINCSNPLLSAQQAGILCTPAQIAADLAAVAAGGRPVTANVEIGRRNVEGGVRFSDYEHTNYRAVLGAKGELGTGWSYDAYGQYYYTSFFTSNEKYMNFRAIDNALLATRDAQGNVVCLSGPPCVPYNIFTEGGVTPAQLDYLYLSGTGFGTTTLRTLHADVTGKLEQYGLQLPTAAEGLAVNVGVEHRNEQVTFKPDGGLASGQLSGFGSAAASIDNSEAVDEAFAELRVPLIQGKAWAKDLVFDTGYRRSQYATSGTVGTYKFELQYAPNDDLRLRASFQHATRAPSIVELYNGALVGLIQLGNDPCAATLDQNNNVVAATRSLGDCLRTVPAAERAQFTAQYGNGGTTNIIPQSTLGQLSQQTGGNVALKPETAQSYSYGVTLTPTALPGFTASVDYYHIKVTDEIGVIPANVVLNNCLDTGDPTYCSQLVRQHNTGSLTGNNIAGGGYIVQKNLNIGAAVISGIDVQGGYKLGLGAGLGSLVFSLNGAYLQHSTVQPLPGAHSYDCAGLFGSTCQTVSPKWHHILRSTWMTPWDLSASLTWRYLGRVSMDQNSNDPTLQFAQYGAYDYYNATLPAMNYFDLAATWSPRKNLELRGGINNLLDKDPPLATVQIVSGGAANTYSTYDSMGRQLFIAFTAKF